MTNQTRASSYIKRQSTGVEWIPPSAGQDGDPIMVRKLSIADHAVINQMPEAIRQQIYKQVEGSTTLRTQQDDDADDESIFQGMSGEEMLKAQDDAAVAICKIGWVSPKAIDGDTNIDADEINVYEIDSGDRQAYLEWVFGGVRAEARRLEPFRGESPGNVRPVPDVQNVSDDAVATHAAGASGVLRRDGV